MPDVTGLDVLISRNSESKMGIDVDSVKLDIDVMETKLLEPMSRIDKRNIKEVKGYIEKILSKTENNVLELAWSLEGSILKSYPVELMHIPEYNIEMTDYISITEGSLVRVDYRDVLQIIAIEMMYRDLGEDSESMEDKLDHIGITGIYPASELLKHFEDDAINLSKIFKVGDSPYRTQDRRIIFEYFGKKEFDGKVYRDCVGYSIKHALSIITLAIMERLTANNIQFQLCSVSDSGVYFVTENDGIEIAEILNESAVVRAFGRRFEVKPEVTVF